MGWFTKKESKSEFTIAIECLASNPSVANQKNFAKSLVSYVENNRWVPMPICEDENGYKFKIIHSRGKRYAALCSDNTHVKKDADFSIAITDINKLIEPVFQNEDVDGIVINPYTTCLCLDKEYLLRCLLHAKYPEQNNSGCPPKNWGEGIPHYTQSDLMTDGEIQNFSLHVVLDNDESIQNKFSFVSACDYPTAIPSIILQSEKGFAFVYVKGYTSMAEPSLTEEEKEILLSLGQKYNAETYYATVGFLSTDPAIFAAELALKGDGFYCKYEGLKKIE